MDLANTEKSVSVVIPQTALRKTESVRKDRSDRARCGPLVAIWSPGRRSFHGRQRAL
jgi:hypothetical protein